MEQPTLEPTDDEFEAEFEFGVAVVSGGQRLGEHGEPFGLEYLARSHQVVVSSVGTAQLAQFGEGVPVDETDDDQQNPVGFGCREADAGQFGQRSFGDRESGVMNDRPDRDERGRVGMTQERLAVAAAVLAESGRPTLDRRVEDHLGIHRVAGQVDQGLVVDRMVTEVARSAAETGGDRGAGQALEAGFVEDGQGRLRDLRPSRVGGDASIVGAARRPVADHDCVGLGRG